MISYAAGTLLAAVLLGLMPHAFKYTSPIRIPSLFSPLTHTVELMRGGFGGDNFFELPLNITVLSLPGRLPISEHAISYHKPKERIIKKGGTIEERIKVEKRGYGRRWSGI
ncbi:hypothetical protein CW706_06605 [Candidatus Bathyarchaeota archaeon]|nr:MAG: hypothetical protein CW706_06605 [Candidatus Bathyarchaeota archaeon]